MEQSRTDKLLSKQGKQSYAPRTNRGRDDANIGESGGFEKKKQNRGGKSYNNRGSSSSRGGYRDRGRGGFRGSTNRGGGVKGDEEEEEEKTEEELKHMEYLKKTYRDLAKERRNKIAAEEKDQNLINQGIVPQEEKPLFGDEQMNIDAPKGLDFDMLKKELEKSKKEQEKNKILLSLNPEEQKVFKNKSYLANCIERAIFPQKKENKVTEIKDNAHYEFDLTHDFGNSIPNLIIKREIKGIDEQERKIIPGSLSKELQQNIDEIMRHFRNGGGDIRAFRMLKKEAEEKAKQKIILNKKIEIDEENIFADANEYIENEEDKKVKKVKLDNFVIPQNIVKESTKIQEDTMDIEIDAKKQIGNVLKRELQKQQREDIRGSRFSVQTNDDDDGYIIQNIFKNIHIIFKQASRQKQLSVLKSSLNLELFQTITIRT